MQTFPKSSPTSAPDAELLNRFAADGEDAAFSELVRRYLPLVLAVTRRRLGDSGLADDAAQQVFIALSRKLRSRHTIPCLPAWLQKAAVFEASTVARTERRHRRRVELAKDHWFACVPDRDDLQLDQALAELSERDRQVLLLHHFEKLPFAGVARRLGISEAAAQRRGHRALEKLRTVLKSKGIERDANACSLWLAASLVPVGTSVSPDLVKRIVSVKGAAAQTLPWLPIAAVLTLAGGTWATVVATRAPASPPPADAAVVQSSRERPKPQRFEPQTPDDKLSDEVREFIARAKRDSQDAWEWTKQRPEGVDRFFRGSEPVRALADRDFPAAERFLETVEGWEPRRQIIEDLFGSRAEGNFESAIVWVESVAERNDLRGVTFIEACWTNSERLDHDYAGALGIARNPKVREWLIRQACEKAMETDETEIEKLAGELKDNERQIALGFAASLLLQRGDPRAYELLEELKSDLWLVPDPESHIALREPQALLEWLAAQKDAHNRDRLASSVLRDWGRRDAASAAAWARSLDEGQRDALRVDYVMDPTFERFLKQP